MSDIGGEASAETPRVTSSPSGLRVGSNVSERYLKKQMRDVDITSS